MAFGKLFGFGKAEPKTFRVKTKKGFNRNIFGTGTEDIVIHYPTALLTLRPGTPIATLRAHLADVAPDFPTDPRWLFAEDFVFYFQLNPQLQLATLRFDSHEIIDDVTVEGVRLREPIEDVLGRFPALKLATTANSSATLPTSETRQNYWGRALSLDVDLLVKDGKVVAITVHPQGWAEEALVRNRVALEQVQRDAKARAMRETWQSITDPTARLRAWAKSGMGLEPGVPERWSWYVEQLIAGSTELWHDAARNWNWGMGVEPLKWIAAQPNCDRATALLIFHMGYPHEVFDIARRRGAAHTPDAAELLLRKIRQQWLDGFYTRSNIAFDASEFEDEVETSARETDEVPASMRKSLPGSPVANGLFFKNAPYPVHYFS